MVLTGGAVYGGVTALRTGDVLTRMSIAQRLAQVASDLPGRVHVPGTLSGADDEGDDDEGTAPGTSCDSCTADDCCGIDCRDQDICKEVDGQCRFFLGICQSSSGGGCVCHTVDTGELCRPQDCVGGDVGGIANAGSNFSL